MVSRRRNPRRMTAPISWRNAMPAAGLAGKSAVAAKPSINGAFVATAARMEIVTAYPVRQSAAKAPPVRLRGCGVSRTSSGVASGPKLPLPAV